MRKILSLMLYIFLVFDFAIGNAEVQGFSQSFHENIKGNIEVIGNTMMTGYKVWWSYCPDDSLANHNVRMTYVKVDGGGDIFNSTSAKLTIPNDAKVVYATLYWQGYFVYPNNGRQAQSKTVKFKPAGSTKYYNLTSDSRYKWLKTPSSIKAYAYQGAVDVTKYVKKSGDYIVANVYTDETKLDNAGPYGGWALVVVYEHDKETYKNITIYDGLAVVRSGYDKKYELSGFLTPIDSNKGVSSNFYYFVGEGDNNIHGDYVALADKSGRFTRLENAVKASNNSFNSKISKGDQLVTQRNPNCPNTLGVDIGSFNVGTNGQNIIGHGQTKTTVELASTRDQYFPGMFAFATDLYEPDLCYTNQAVFMVRKDGTEKRIKPNTSLSPHSTIRAETFIKNKSLDAKALKVRLSHEFKDDSPYKENTLQMSDVNKTDAKGDDLAHYDPVSKKIFFHLGGGATHSNGGEIDKGGISEKISFMRDLNGSRDLTLLYHVDYEKSVSLSTPLSLSGTRVNRCDGKTDFVVRISGYPKIVVSDNVNGNNDNKTYTKVVGQKEAEYKITVPDSLLNKYDPSSDPDLTIIFDDEKVQTTKLRDPKPFKLIGKFNEAKKSVGFEYIIGDGLLADGNASGEVHDETDETFAIRPAKLLLVGVDGDSINGIVNETELAIKSIDAVNLDLTTKSKGYSTSIPFDGTFTTSLSSTACEVSTVTPKDGKSIIVGHDSTILKTGNVTFVDGVGTVYAGSSATDRVRFAEVGDFNLTLTDPSWTQDDIDNKRCDINSSRNRLINGKVGCDVAGSIHVLMLPKELKLKIAPRHNKNWSYMSEMPDYDGMDLSAMVIDGTIYGYVNSAGDFAKNLNRGCYSPNIGVKLNSSSSDFPSLANESVGAVSKKSKSVDGFEHNISANWKDRFVNSSAPTIGVFDSSLSEFNITAGVTRKHDAVRAPVKLENLHVNFNLPLPGDIGASSMKDIDDSMRIVLSKSPTATVDIKPFEYTHHFYYGRVFIERKFKTTTRKAKVRFYNEIYCPENNCIDVSGERLNKDWNVVNDSLTLVDLSASFGNKFGEMSKRDIEFDLNNRSIGTYPVHLDIKPFLHKGIFPYKKAANISGTRGCDIEHPCTFIERIGESPEWGGTKENATKRRFEDSTSKTKSPQRVGW